MATKYAQVNFSLPVSPTAEVGDADRARAQRMATRIGLALGCVARITPMNEYRWVYLEVPVKFVALANMYLKGFEGRGHEDHEWSDPVRHPEWSDPNWKLTGT